mmetsp:Transcript_3679/g.6258  ORF Transcript_3679/g.6258 Transcript_3679/m.6258 type:complete len:270 (+) Transcript_3679:43-852(+)
MALTFCAKSDVGALSLFGLLLVLLILASVVLVLTSVHVSQIHWHVNVIHEVRGRVAVQLVGSSELTAINDGDCPEWFVLGAGGILLDLLDELVSLDDPSEDGVLLVEVGRGSEADEELGAVGVFAGVGHGEDSLVGVGEPDLLVLKLLAVDAVASSPVLVGDVSSLRHESLDDPVEDVALVVVVGSLLSRADGPEVLGSLWHLLGEDLEDDPLLLRCGLALTRDLDVEVGLCVLWVELGQLGEDGLLLGRLLLVVDTLGEELLHELLLA